jgi:hypothetical protein
MRSISRVSTYSVSHWLPRSGAREGGEGERESEKKEGE